MIKTIALTGGEQEVKFNGKQQYFHVHNLGGGDVLVSLAPKVERGKDDVLIVPSGGTGYVQNDMAADTVYLRVQARYRLRQQVTLSALLRGARREVVKLLPRAAL